LVDAQARAGVGNDRAVRNEVAANIEAVAYPCLWKVLEAVRGGLPDGELRTRIEVMGRRLSRTFAEEIR